MPLRVADPRLWFNLPGVVAAYQPIGAPDPLTARQNMAHGGDGRYAAAPGTAPTWASRVGWTFNGTDQWLSTGVVLTNDQSWSFVLRYSGASGTNRAIALSRTGTGTTDFGIYISDYIATYVYNGSYLLVNHSSITGGVWAITGNVAYLNGSAVSGTISSGSGTATVAFPLGAMDDDGARSLWYAGNIQAAAIYNRTLTAAEVWLASQQMAYCDAVVDYSVWTPTRRWFFSPLPRPTATPSTIYLNTADIGDTSLWDTVDNSEKVTVSTTTARTGTYSFELDEAAADANTPKLHAMITATSTVYVRCGLYYTALPTSATRIIRLCETATEHVNVYLNTDGTLSVALGTTVLQTGATVLAATTWYCIELRAVIHDAVGTFELRIDGTRELRMVNIDTRNGGTNGTINTVKFCGAVSSSNSLLYYDDIAIRNDDWCGQGGLYVAVPSADGDASDWTPSAGDAYACVKELPPSFGEYVYTDPSVVEVDHNFTHNGIPGDVYDSIPLVAIYARVRLSESGEANLKTYGKSEDTTGYSAAEAITDAESWVKQYLTVDPNGSAAWTLGAVNQIYLGVETA